MAGLLGKLFGKKEDKWENEVPRRIEAKSTNTTPEDDAGQRWKLAKKWREDKALQEPLVKRNEYKRRIQ